NGDPVVDASPREVHELRPVVCAVLRRHGCPEREIDDITQHVEIVLWQNIGEGRVHGHDLEEPRDALVMYMVRVAQNAYLNFRSKASTRREVLPDEPVDIVSRSPIARMEARDLLRKFHAHPSVARLLMNVAQGMPLVDREQDAEMTSGTYYVRITSMQKWARKVARTGLWQRPPMPDPPTPKLRKKKR
ncbi:MAG TPA: hypothetical protein PKA58_17000, partial [Polyangium sp.]|nr:hypothetical protein [Polyangium sp.]